MSHNNHYIIVRATDEEQAQFVAEDELSNFGDDNNWYTIDCVINLKNMSEEDKKYVEKELEYYNKEISNDRTQKVIEEIDRLQQQLSTGQRNIYWQLAENYKLLYELTGVKEPQPVTVENINNVENYFGYKYDEYGLTHLENWHLGEEGEVYTYFIVVDMHS